MTFIGGLVSRRGSDCKDAKVSSHLCFFLYLECPHGLHYANMSMQYTAIFHGCKNGNFSVKKCYIFSYFCSNHRLRVHVRTAFLTSIRNLCLGAN